MPEKEPQEAMPMFQVQSGRSVAVHPAAPARSSFGAETGTMVAEHLDTLLGEQLLPLRIRSGDQDEPYLLAVDAAGQPVVVEVVAVLDEQAVLRALRFAGRAAGLSTQDLAAAYRAGPGRFATDLAAFRDTVPATTLLSTTVKGGSRLLLVCSEIAPGAEEVVEFLLQPGWHVDVLQVGVVPGANGTRIVDVSPLTRRPPARRAMEPGLQRTPGRAQLTPPRGTPNRPDPPTGPVLRAVEAGTTPLRPPVGHRMAPHERPTVAAPAEPTRRIPTVVAPPFAFRVGSVAGRDPGVPAGSTAPPAPPPPESTAPAASTEPTARPDPSEPSEPQLTSGAHAVVRDVSASDQPSEPGLPYAFTGVMPTSVPDPRLVALGSRLGGPVPLVWRRQRRGDCFEALLRPDGLIELPDGARCTDPDAAAAAVSAASVAVDGWRVWRLERATGPSLGDAVARQDQPAQP